MQPKYISGLTLLGGEPFEPQNQRELVPVFKEGSENCIHKKPSGLSPVFGMRTSS